MGIAAEGATAVVMARGNRRGWAISIVPASSAPLSLPVAPLPVLSSDVVGSHPIGLAFGGGLRISVPLGVRITGNVARDGRSNWLRGVSSRGCPSLGVVPRFAPDAPG